MIHIKKTILTLALLIAATTQAWAGEIFTTLKVGDVIHVGDQFTISEDWGCINYFFDSYLSPFTLIRANAPDFDPNAAETYVTPDEDGAYYVIQCNYNGETLYGFTYYDRFPATANSDGLVVTNIDTSGMHKVYTFAVHEAYPVPVAWDADTKTGTIAKMPAGNVEVSPEYFPQATAGNGAVTAATGAQAQTDSPLVTVDNAKLTGASALKFCVTTTNSAPGYDDTGWTTNVPTAKDFNADGGTAFVWYYPVGNDDTDPTKIYSDGDMCATALEVTVAAAPTYNVVLNSIGLSTEEAGKWSSSPSSGITPGETVTVTYSGSRKVIGVKAEKIDGSFAADEYIEASWDETTRKVLHAMKKASTTPVAITSSTTTWLDGWYTVSGNVTITGNVSLAANTYLILQDGANLTINGQLVCNDYNLYIYGQGKGDGKLNVTYSNATAMNCEHGLIEIHGGEIFASATLPSSYGRVAIRAAGIKVYGGKLAATSASSTGIIFGNGNFEVYGGEVDGTSTAPTSDSYSGIAGKANFFILKVYGGKVKATGNGGTWYSDYGVGINCLVQSGTSDIKFYFSDDGSTWDSGTVFGTATAAPSDMRYAKAE